MTMTPIVTYSATAKGGRDGRSVLDNGGLGLVMSLPKELGGSGEGHNPEQMFALGYAACFNSALLKLSKAHGIDATPAKVIAAVSLNKDDTSFALSVELKVSIPGADRAKVEALVHDAHQICPYSKATRGNVPVTLTVV